MLFTSSLQICQSSTILYLSRGRNAKQEPLEELLDLRDNANNGALGRVLDDLDAALSVERELVEEHIQFAVLDLRKDQRLPTKFHNENSFEVESRWGEGRGLFDRW